MRRRLAHVVCAGGLALAALAAGPALGANECDGLRVCLPVAGPWVVVPAGGVDYELACPLAGYIIGGVDARVATRDVDVSFRGEPGSPVGPGVTTRRSAVFHAERARVGGGASASSRSSGASRRAAVAAGPSPASPRRRPASSRPSPSAASSSTPGCRPRRRRFGSSARPGRGSSARPPPRLSARRCSRQTRSSVR